jgi:hypothetical protein
MTPSSAQINAISSVSRTEVRSGRQARFKADDVARTVKNQRENWTVTFMGKTGKFIHCRHK